MPAPTADQIPELIDSPQFKELPFEKRKSVAESALAEGAAGLAGKWDKDTYQKWGQFAQTVRDRVGASETMMETAGRYADVAGSAIKDSFATAGTMALGLSPVVPTAEGIKGQIPGETLVPMVGANLGALATGAAQRVLDDPKPLQGKLQELKKGIDEGAFFDAEGGLPAWLDQQDAAVRAEQAKFYREAPDANGAWHKENSLLGRPENADALNVYLRTRSPEAWQRLEQAVLETPGMRNIQQQKQKLMTQSTLAQGLTPEAQPYIQAAGDPAELAGTVLTAGAGGAALKAGRTALQRGASVAGGVGAEMLSEQVSASMESAYVPWEQRVQIAKDSLAASLGLMGVGAAAKRLGQEKPTPQRATNEPVSAGQTPVANPFSGPIEAPPQPTEDGGVVAGDGAAGQAVNGQGVAPQRPQVPAFRDDPFNAPQPAAGGNVLRDFGIAKSPNAQAIADAADMERQKQEAKLRGMEQQAGTGRARIPDSPLGSYDILDFLNQHQLQVARKGSEQEGKAGYDWQERYNIPLYYRKFIASSERGYAPDELIGLAQTSGFPGVQSVDDLMDLVQTTINQRTQYRVQFRQKDKALQEEAKQVLSFEKDQAKAGEREKTLVALDDVAPGDEMTINGERAVVSKIDYDEDGYLTNVVIEDGKRYGVMSLDPTTRAGVFVDEYQPRQREQAAPDFEDPFSMQSVTEEELAAEKERAKQRATIAARQSAALTGDAGEYGTPDLLDTTAGSMALFNQPPTRKDSLQVQTPASVTPGPERAATDKTGTQAIGAGSSPAAGAPSPNVQTSRAPVSPTARLAAEDAGGVGVPAQGQALSYDQLVRIATIGQEANRKFSDLTPNERNTVAAFAATGLPATDRNIEKALKDIGIMGAVAREVAAVKKNLPTYQKIQAWKQAEAELTNRERDKQERDKAQAKADKKAAKTPPQMPGVTEGQWIMDANGSMGPVIGFENGVPIIGMEGDNIGDIEPQKAVAPWRLEDDPYASVQTVSTENPDGSVNVEIPLEDEVLPMSALLNSSQKLQAIKQGQPVTMYHGSPNNKLTRIAPNSSWTTSKKLAAKYAGADGRIYETTATVPESNPAFRTAQDWNLNPDSYFDRPNEIRLSQEIPVADEVLPMTARYQRPAVSGPLPSTVSNAAPPAVIQTWSGTVQTLHGIRRHLLNTVGLPAVGVGRFKGALGIYKAKPEAIRLQAINDVPVLAHEVGHALHYRVLSDQTPGQRVKATDWGGVYDAELLAMGKATSAPTYTPDQVRKEGVAEFIRGWLVDPVGTRAKAPRFSAFFDAEMQRRAPEMLEGLRNTRFMIQDYIAMPAFQKAKAQVVFDPASERQAWSWPEWLKKTYAQAVNTIQPALDMTRAAAEQPGLESQAAEVEAWMENHRGGWASKAGADVFGHQTDLFGNRVGEGLKSILSGLRPGENESFSTYLALKRAAEIERSGKRSGFENAKLPANEMTALETRFEPMRQKLIKWQRNERNLLVQSGLLDAKAAADMDAANADYVPFYRLYEKLNGVSFGPEGGKNAGGYVDLNSGIRALKGSDRAIIDPLQSAMKNAFMFRKIAEQNLIGQKFFDLVKEVQGGGKWGDAISPKMKPTMIGHDTIVAKLVDEGVIKDASMLPSSADLTLRLFQAVTKPDTKNGEVIIFRDGKREHWEVKDPLLMNALRYADADSVKLGGIPSWMVKIMTVPTKVLRWGATGGPWFALPNMIRDAVQGGVLSKSGFIPFVDSFRGAMEMMSKSGVYEQWKEAGGQFSGMVTGSEAFSSLLEDALPKDPIARRAMQGLADPKAWRGGFRNALRLIGSVGQFTEEATRVGEFKRALDAGKSSLEAANLSKTVSLNFARAGEISRVLNQFVPFFNATIQGLDQLVRAHADPKTRGATITKGLLYITAPSVACWALGKDDPEIQNLPEWRKNMFWNINLKPLARALGEEGFILSIPKPFLLGAIYGTSVERALDQATGRDPNGARKAASNILDNTVNPFDIMTGIAGMRPLYEAWANKSLFTDRAIVPDSMRNLPAEYQYTTLTSETAKMIGGWTGQSPMVIDHLIRGYFATAGRFGSDAIDYGMTKLGVADAPPAAAKGWMELPILNRFAGSPYEANAFVERVYNSAKEMEGLMSTWNKQADQMTTDEHAKYWQKHGDLIMQFTRTVDARTGLTGAGQVRKAMTSLGEISKAMKEVQASREMTPDVKATRLRELAKQRNVTAEETFKTLMPAEIRKKHY